MGLVYVDIGLKTSFAKILGVESVSAAFFAGEGLSPRLISVLNMCSKVDLFILTLIGE